MKLNCKPGDLAVIVGKQAPGERHFEGQIRRVTQLADTGKHWAYEGEPLVSRFLGVCLGIADEHLRPIRDPGEDARDETLEWLPVPARTPEVA